MHSAEHPQDAEPEYVVPTKNIRTHPLSGAQ
jgi:hypothetical protein